MKNITLERVIRQYVKLSHPNTKGWYPCVHVGGCDRGHKGNRAAWMFSPEGSVAFHCFNCTVKTVYDPSKHQGMPSRMLQVLQDFSVPEDEWQAVILSNMGTQTSGFVSNSSSDINNDIEPNVIEMPKHFYPLDSVDENDKWAIIARDYLENSRLIDPTSYQFYLSTGEGDKEAKKWKGRLIIPVYKDNKLVYYQGRSLVPMTRKYMSPSLPKNKILYGYDKLFNHSPDPLYVVEGWFDARSIDGVATFGNVLTEEQIAWLKRSNREKVIIPDQFGDGHIMAEQALELGWKISTPDVGSAKDMNAAVKKYGKMYTMKTIIDNTRDGFGARMALEVYCKSEQDTNKTKGKKTY